MQLVAPTLLLSALILFPPWCRDLHLLAPRPLPLLPAKGPVLWLWDRCSCQSQAPEKQRSYMTMTPMTLASSPSWLMRYSSSFKCFVVERWHTIDFTQDVLTHGNACLQHGKSVIKLYSHVHMYIGRIIGHYNLSSCPYLLWRLNFSVRNGGQNQQTVF